MRKLSEYKDEEALDLLADIMEPAAEILADSEMKDAWETGNRLRVAKVAIKRHKTQVMEILAAMDGVPVSEYHCNIFTLTMRVIEIMNDEELLSVFTSQAQELMQSTASGPVTGNTGAEEA